MSEISDALDILDLTDDIPLGSTKGLQLVGTALTHALLAVDRRQRAVGLLMLHDATPGGDALALTVARELLGL